MSNKTAFFEYKCRRCGKISVDICGGEKDADNDLIKSMMALNNPFGRYAIDPKLQKTNPKMYEKLTKDPQVAGFSVHSCADRGRGISDLIGYSLE